MLQAFFKIWPKYPEINISDILVKFIKLKFFSSTFFGNTIVELIRWLLKNYIYLNLPVSTPNNFFRGKFEEKEWWKLGKDSCLSILEILIQNKTNRLLFHEKYKRKPNGISKNDRKYQSPNVFTQYKPNYVLCIALLNYYR